jgi:Ca-activated chloride channel family protein
MTITFDNPAGLLWLIAAAAITVLGVGTALWRRRAATRFADAALVARIAPGLSLSRGIWRAVLLGGAACCLSVALMDPRAAEQTEEVTRRGADVMFVVDVSRSMLAEDASPNRLERARTFISDAIDAMGGDRAGLIDFAGVAAVRAPLTLNYDALKAAVDGLEPKDSRRGGSMLGDAIRLAAESFPTDDAGHAIVILSDGEDMGSDPLDAAKEAAERGIRIVTVGIGDAREGARIPVGDGPNRRFLVHDGEEVWSRMDAATLRDVADATGGLYVPAATAQVELGEILTRTLSDLERTEGDSSVARTTAPLFQWPAGLALVLLVIESMVSARARRSSPAQDTMARAVRNDASPAPSVRRAGRRARPKRATAGAPAAVIAAVAGIAGLAADSRAAAQVADAPAAAAATADGDASRTAEPARAGAVPRGSGEPRARRTVGRGQIDRDAFREAVTRANAAMKSGQYAEAASAFADAMDADPTSAAAAYNRGVAEYRAGQLDDAAASFSEAATRGDASLAADAMFNQGNATYQSALKVLESPPADADPAGVPPSATGASPAQPDLKAATEAVSKALTHYKDAIAANPEDIDSRANAELAHTLLKQLEEMQQQQNEQQQKDDQQQKDEQDKQEKDQQDQEQKKDQQQDGEECDNPQQGDGEGKSGSESSDKPSSGESGAESDPREDPQPKEGDQPKDPSQDGRDEKADSDKSEEGKKDDQQPDAGDSDAKDQKDAKDESGSESKDDGKSREQRGNAQEQDAKDPKGTDGELKALNGAEQPASDQKPPAPAQARAGEPVPGAPLTKSEAERLLQGVRDRAKQRMEAKERAERVRQVPAVRDW